MSGIIYWDRDGDGTRDDGEPPLNLGALLMEAEGTGIWASASNSRDGRYSITFRAGTYRMEPNVDTGAGLCVDAFRGSHQPFAISSCYSARFPYSVTARGEPFELGAGDTLVRDLPVLVADMMVFSLRAVEEDHYARAGDVVTAMINGNECGSATVPAPARPEDRDNNFPLLVEGVNATTGCAAQGDEITFVLNGRTARNAPVKYERFDPSPNELVLDHHHIRRIDLVFMEHWAWFWSDDVHAFDGGEIKGAQIAAVAGGRNCALGMPFIGLLDEITGQYGFGPVYVGLSGESGGCAQPGESVEFRIGHEAGELVATATWQPGVTQLSTLVLQDPPRPIGDPPPVDLKPPNTGVRDSTEARYSMALLAVLTAGVAVLAAGAIVHARERRT